MTSTEKDVDELEGSALGLEADLKQIETGVRVTRKRTFSPSSHKTAVKAYAEKFGHFPAVEAYKFLSMEELEDQAERAIEKGEPIAYWRDRSRSRTGSSLDGFYGFTDEESE
jgi:hypothetical protein